MSQGLNPCNYLSALGLRVVIWKMGKITLSCLELASNSSHYINKKTNFIFSLTFIF